MMKKMTKRFRKTLKSRGTFIFPAVCAATFFAASAEAGRLPLPGTTIPVSQISPPRDETSSETLPGNMILPSDDSTTTTELSSTVTSIGEMKHGTDLSELVFADKIRVLVEQHASAWVETETLQL